VAIIVEKLSKKKYGKRKKTPIMLLMPTFSLKYRNDNIDRKVVKNAGIIPKRVEKENPHSGIMNNVLKGPAKLNQVKKYQITFRKESN